MAERLQIKFVRTFPKTIAVIVFLGALIAVVSTQFPNAAEFKLETGQEIVEALLGLFVAALFMERVQEVVVTAWCQGERLTLESNLEDAKRVANEDGASDEDRQAVLDAERALKYYKNSTKVFAFSVGLFIGFIFALLGVRALAEVMIYENLAGFQSDFFAVIDLLVTAGVIAGGSDAIHKLISVFTDAFDATRRRLKEQPGTSASPPPPAA